MALEMRRGPRRHAAIGGLCALTRLPPLGDTPILGGQDAPQRSTAIFHAKDQASRRRLCLSLNFTFGKATLQDCASPRNGLAPGAQYELPNAATSNAALNFVARRPDRWRASECHRALHECMAIGVKARIMCSKILILDHIMGTALR